MPLPSSARRWMRPLSATNSGGDASPLRRLRILMLTLPRDGRRLGAGPLRTFPEPERLLQVFLLALLKVPPTARAGTVFGGAKTAPFYFSAQRMGKSG